MTLKKRAQQTKKRGVSSQKGGRDNLKHRSFELTSPNKTTTQRWILAILLSVVLAWFISPGAQRPPKSYLLGGVVDENIKAPKDFLVEDEPSTQKRIREAEEKLRVIYDYDDGASRALKKKLVTAFGPMREVYKKALEEEREKFDSRKTDEADTFGPDQKGDVGPPGPFVKKEVFLQKKAEFGKILSITFSDEAFSVLNQYRFDPSIEKHILSLIRPVWEKGVVSNKEILLNEKEKGIVLRMLEAKKEKPFLDIASMLDLQEARWMISRVAQKKSADLDKGLSTVILDMALKLVVPNTTFNKKETEERRKALRESVKPVYFQIKKGEMIVREGEKIREEQLIKLKGLMQLRKGAQNHWILIGMILLFCLLFFVIYLFGSRHYDGFPKQNKDFLMIACLLVLMVLMTKASIFIAHAIHLTSTSLPYESLLYAIPFAAGAMLVSICINPKVALLFGTIFSILAALCLENRLFFFIYPFIGSLLGAIRVGRCKQRSTVLLAGVVVGLMNVATVLFLNMMNGNLLSLQSLMTIPFALIGGVLVGIIVTGLAPLVETIFGYVTDIKLLEMASLDKPIMRDLMMRAPGTYYHCVLVGNLVESASEAIGANPLLAKVSAYYHDLGKIKKPLYYIENQNDGMENPHDRLSPSMSSLILISHTKDGVDLARRNRVGKPIIDIIQQHHGTNLISYFYQKAKSKEKDGQQSIKEEDFRYPGPKPQTREAAIVMLADAVEAASKTLSDPTSSRIQGLVQRIINQIFIDGQLNECELTLLDLQLISETFTRILTGIFHHRVDYPEAVKEAFGNKGNHEDLDKRPSGRNQNGQRKDQAMDGADIRTIGIPAGRA